MKKIKQELFTEKTHSFHSLDTQSIVIHSPIRRKEMITHKRITHTYNKLSRIFKYVSLNSAIDLQKYKENFFLTPRGQKTNSLSSFSQGFYIKLHNYQIQTF